MKAQALSYNGTSIMIFEDFSAAVVKKRQDFYSAKQQLKERDIVYLLYPAVLRIRYDGQERFFEQPKDVEAFESWRTEDIFSCLSKVIM